MVLLMTICLMAAAQDKMTLGAQQLISSQQAAGQDGQRAANAAEQRVALVIKVNDDKAVETYQAIRALGGEIQGVLGEQALISLPLQRVEAVSMLDGVERIDVEHSGHNHLRRNSAIMLPTAAIKASKAAPTAESMVFCMSAAALQGG